MPGIIPANYALLCFPKPYVNYTVGAALSEFETRKMFVAGGQRSWSQESLADMIDIIYNALPKHGQKEIASPANQKLESCVNTA